VTVTADDDLDGAPAAPAAPTGARERYRPTLLQAIVFAVAAAFLASAVTMWWTDRGDKPNAADVGFYDDMTTHHYQALAMAGTYLRYGTDRVLRIIAGEIQFEQAGDIRQMQWALTEWGKEGTPAVAMQWMGMPVAQDAQPGMATKAELAALGRARGRTLDDQFTRLMIDHHAAGAAMADAAIERANVGEVKRLATIMRTGQRYEIAEMNRRREQIGLPVYEPPADLTSMPGMDH
jgi:uncharacterized protein (DUF305 family)